MSTPNGKVYRIATLRDIFELPTIDAMERCLEETKAAMLQTRAYGEMIVGIAQDLAQKNGKEIPGDFNAHQWPLETIWTDDGGLPGTNITFIGANDEVYTEMRIEKAGAKEADVK